MIPLFSVDAVRSIDSLAIDTYGFPGIVLMENASLSIMSAIHDYAPGIQPADHIGILCGKGNNGGDGFAVARHFYAAGNKVTVIHLGDYDELSPDAQANFSILSSIAAHDKRIDLVKYVKPQLLKKLQSCIIIIDALLGSGVKGSLRAPYDVIVSKVNDYTALKVAVDMPTGLDADTGYAELAFRADLTVTLAEYKRGLFVGDALEYAGEVVRGSIGLSGSFSSDEEITDYLIEPEDAYFGLPEKPVNVHKYTAGKVACICGSGKFPGAAVLTAMSALKAGAGASVLLFPASVRELVSGSYPELVVRTYDDQGLGMLTPEALDELDEHIRWADTVALGPGIGRDEKTIEAVIELIKRHKKTKFVIDADAIFALGQGRYKEISLKNTVLTPHPGEFSTLTGRATGTIAENLLGAGKAFAAETGAYLVLKGARSVLFNPHGEAFVNTTGNEGMAKFGTGDVLTGVLAALIAQADDIEPAVIAGLYLHSLSGDLLKEEQTEYGFTSAELMENYPRAVKFLRESID